MSTDREVPIGCSDRTISPSKLRIDKASIETLDTILTNEFVGFGYILKSMDESSKVEALSVPGIESRPKILSK